MAGKFSFDISKFVQRAKGNTDKVVRKIVIDMGTKVIKRNPVGDPDGWISKPREGYVGGRSRGNWQYSHGISSSVVNNYSVDDNNDPGAAFTIGALQFDILLAPTASIHWIANGLPYMRRLEDGWSNQAPNGMVKLTVAEFDNVARAAAGSVRK